jgi:hypothetical protein
MRAQGMHKFSRHVDDPVGKKHLGNVGFERFGTIIQLGATWVWNDLGSVCRRFSSYIVTSFI